jgi:hypothetical protein
LYATDLIEIKTNKNPQELLNKFRDERKSNGSSKEEEEVIVTNDVITEGIKGLNINNQGK